jgi:hypothetical protein
MVQSLTSLFFVNFVTVHINFISNKLCYILSLKLFTMLLSPESCESEKILFWWSATAYLNFI